MTAIADIEGIGGTYGEKLQGAGVATTEALLSEGGTPAGRKALSEKSGISESLILEWVNHADLYRIDGIGSEYADLLEAAGVDTVAELAQRNAPNLTAAIATLNEQKQLVRSAPAESAVSGWIEQAKQLPRLVSY
jgi:predicted flap endonuclease-1-like 5' DNA nuclease